MVVLITLGIAIMAWHNAGAGAGVWQNAVINPSLKNILHEICTAINEREIARCYYTSTHRKVVSSITRSGSTATVTTSADHDLVTGDYVYVRGADQSEYNGLVQITKTGNTTFTFAVGGLPATPATGTMRAYAPATRFTYNENGDQKHFPAVADFVGMPISRVTNGPERLLYVEFTPTSITSSAGVATVTATSAEVAALAVGDTIEVSGADQSAYNIVATVASKPTSTTFTYAITGSPASPATGTITVKRHGRITRSGSVATVHLPGHGFSVGSIANISGATQSEYNGYQIVTALGASPSVSSIVRASSTATVTTGAAHGLLAGDAVIISGCVETQYNGLKTIVLVPSSTTFTFSVSGSPSSPASGSPACENISVFQFAVSGTPASPATGGAKCTANRHMIPYATHSGGTATIYCFDHGFSNGDYVEIVPNRATYSDWSAFAAISGVDTNSFNIALSAPSSATWLHSIQYTMHAVKEGVFRRILREMQSAIDTLATSPGVLGARFVEDDGAYDTPWTSSSLRAETSYGSSWFSLKGLLRSDLDTVLTQIREALDLLTHVHFGAAQVSVGTTHDEYTGDDSSASDAWDEATAATPVNVSSGNAPLRAVGSSGGVYTVSIYDNFLVTLEFRSPNIGSFVEGSYVVGDNATRNDASNTMDAFDIEDKDGNVTTLDVGMPAVPPFSASQDKEVEIDDAWMTDGVVFDFTLAQVSIPSTPPFSVSTNSVTRSANIDIADMRFIRELVPGTHLTYG